MIKTKEMLSNENATLKAKIEQQEKEDLRIRTTLSELLDSYSWEDEGRGFYNGRKKVVNVQSWEGIAFLMGELKADANYAMCIEAREELKQEVNNLQMRISELMNPKEDGRKV